MEISSCTSPPSAYNEQQSNTASSFVVDILLPSAPAHNPVTFYLVFSSRLFHITVQFLQKINAIFMRFLADMGKLDDFECAYLGFSWKYSASIRSRIRLMSKLMKTFRNSVAYESILSTPHTNTQKCHSTLLLLL